MLLTSRYSLLRFLSLFTLFLLYALPAWCLALPPAWGWQLEQVTPRAPGHFTQGLVFGKVHLYESTGQYGESAVYSYRKNDLALTARVDLPADLFGEGLALSGNQLYQLTWQSRQIRVYRSDLAFEKSMPFDMEGWGLTSDGIWLIASNGSDTLFFMDPATGQIHHQITVQEPNGKRWSNLNELEWVNGVLLANVWHQDVVLAINPHTGHIIGHYNFEPLSQRAGKAMQVRTGEQVLNGMAWDPDSQRLLLTGKDWPLWFTVRLQPIPTLTPP